MQPRPHEPLGLEVPPFREADRRKPPCEVVRVNVASLPDEPGGYIVSVYEQRVSMNARIPRHPSIRLLSRQ